MKTIEEKAKAYDEAIERAKQQLEGAKVFDYDNEQIAHDIRTTVYNIFQELKESEDEKIRKALISAINNICAGDEGLVTFNGFSKEQVLAWLEKQGKHANFRNKIQIGDNVTRNDNGELVNLSQLERVAKKLEKQEEQKPVEEYNITGIGSKNAQGKLAEMIKNLKPVNEVLEQKSADKVEPKFNVGDWVVTSYGMVNQIIAVDEDGDGFALDDDTYLSGSWKDNFHIWTIQDAKDGDVLVASDGSIFLFKGTNDCACKHYVALATDGAVKFNEGLEHYWETSTAVHPATKEQREQLEKAMADAGYTFDFEKKELKKIEQKSATMSLDEAIEHCKEKSCGNNACALEHKQLEKWLTELKELKEQKPAWSEEDEAHFDSIIKRLEEMRKPLSPFAVTRCSINGDKNWLKSLKDRYTWKPSEEQMRALRLASQNDILANTTILQGLYNDIKKLN